MVAGVRFQRFLSRDLASRAAASWLECKLRKGMEQSGKRGLIVSGGSTPGQCLELLSKTALDWPAVQVSLTDERQVPVDDAASNERMVRAKLLRNQAAEASFVKVGELPAENIACSLVGMGDDGHFASIFPDNPDLKTLLDTDALPSSRDVVTAGSPHPRTTVNLAYLLQSEAILLLIFGAEKQKIIDEPGKLPVAGLLKQDRVPVDIYWAP